MRCSIETDKMLGGKPYKPAPPGGPFDAAEITQYSRSVFLHRKKLGDMTKAMQRSGPGARGIVVGLRGPGRQGHAFNVVNQKGVVRFLDGQIGGPANLDDGFISFLFTYTRRGVR
ncbi:toxin glutamine deamidase domain-containing protein [Micromonospora sp. CPCC 205554]|uniref:toxin glutamine deamidase domain-containing protein n=1 Tax=unclassified Micromonospora TaxID=2617518 RepID=UPI003FA52E2E